MNRITAIKTFFEQDGGRKVSMEEMKNLKAAGEEGFMEVAELCAKQLGVELSETGKP